MNLDAILGHLGTAILIAIPFLLVYALAFKEIRRRKERRAAIHALSSELTALQEQISVVSTRTVPGRDVVKDLGPIAAQGSAGAGFLGVAEKRALITLMRRAKALGADAIVEIRHERPTDSTGKVLMQTGTVSLAGRAVRLSDPGKSNPSL